MAAAARYLQARLAEIAQTLGIRFPVYILYTKTDRVPFFTEFVNTFNNEEAAQVFGVTVPIRPAQQTGVYADDESRRLTGYYDNLFYSLCDKRIVFPPRDGDVERICGAYEFPREMRKLRDLVVRFMVDVCRPSQLSTSPFLRGFYFSGVRPVVVSDAAPIAAAARPREADYHAEGASSATGMFRVGKKAEMIAQQAVAQPMAASRKVPQWMFLGNLFNGIILGDSAAMSASGSSVKVSALRRGLLIAAAATCLVLSGIFLWSFLGNRALENQALTAAQNIKPDQLAAKDVPTMPALQQLETLRQSLETLNTYENDYTPIGLRWGLYRGTDMLPEVQRLYFQRFKALLFGQTQGGLLKIMQGVKSPPEPTADYKYPYETLKGYLLTTNEYKRTSDASLRDFLGTLLLTRWSQNREADIGKDRMDLAKKQFDYYARYLGTANPYSDKGDADAIKGTRIYLSGFKGPQRVYVALLGETAKQGKPINFNQWAEGSAAVLLSTHPVAFAFSKPGAKYMSDQIAKANFGGEKWVLGEYAGQSEDTETMQKGITDLFAKDYIAQWRAVLSTSKFVPYTDLKDASKKLTTLTSSTAPILALFSWTSQNTTVELPGVKEAFKAVQTVEPPTAVAYVPSAQAYNDSLQNLQASIDKAVEANSDPSGLKGVQDMADAARRETRKVASTLPADPEAHVEAVVGDLMMKPITDAERLIKGHDADDLNRKGAGFCGSFGAITRKFPFNKDSREDATLSEVADIFKPKEGQLWKLYDGGLNKVVLCNAGDCKAIDNPTVSVTPTFLNFFRQAVRLSRALYGDAGADPAYHYTLVPHKSDQVESFDVTVNGDVSKLAGGAQKAFIWPGSPSPSFKLSLNLAGGTGLGYPVQNSDSLWAVFRFFADANQTAASGSSYDFVWDFSTGRHGAAPIVAGRPLSFAFTVDTGGAPAVFSKEFLASMKCVPTIAK
jgi:type VI secretion system protein ImpL